MSVISGRSFLSVPAVMMSLWAVLVLAGSAVCAQAATLHYSLVISRALVAPDGFQKAALVINGDFIGPTIEAFVGDTVLVNVTNNAFDQESLTIHWHGVTGIKNAWHDGAQSVTNCPIPPGSSFQQTFTALSEGTFFYHTHTGTLRSEGTYGVIAIKSRNPFHHYDDEISLILSDWYHESVLDLTAGLQSNPFKWVYNGNSILMNGKGLSKECNNDTVPTNTTTQITYSDGTVFNSTSSCLGKRERFVVEQGKTYLLRLINAASLGYYNFAIAGHTMTIIGTGSSATTTSVTNSIEISAGQRVEVLISTDQHTLDPNEPDDTHSFLMSAQSDYRGPDNSFAGIGMGYFTYANPLTSPENLNFDSVSATSPLHDHRNWSSWHPLLKQDSTHPNFKPPPETNVDPQLYVTRQEWVDTKTGKGFDPVKNSSVVGDKSMSLAWTLNGQRLVIPETPLLLTSYIGQQRVHDPSILRLNIGDVVDITVQNSVATNGVCESHPWHVHGNAGWLVGEGSGAFDPVVDPARYNLVDPPYIDTVTNYPSAHSGKRNTIFSKGDWQTPCGWFTMRMEITEPGMWFFHCHIDWHVVMGMALVLDVESETIAPYPEDMALCGDAVVMDNYRQGESDNSNYSAGQVAGIAIGSFFSALILAIGVCLLYLYKRPGDSAGSRQPVGAPSDSPLHDEL